MGYFDDLDIPIASKHKQINRKTKNNTAKTIAKTAHHSSWLLIDWETTDGVVVVVVAVVDVVASSS